MRRITQVRNNQAVHYFPAEIATPVQGTVWSPSPKDEFLAFHQQENDDRCMEMEEGFRPTDDDVKRWILKITKCQNISEFQLLDCKKRNAYIHKLHENGASIRQISRLTGISKKIVEHNI